MLGTSDAQKEDLRPFVENGVIAHDQSSRESYDVHFTSVNGHIRFRITTQSVVVR